MSPNRPLFVAFENTSCKTKILCTVIILGFLFKECLGECVLAELTDDVATKKHEQQLLKKIRPLNGLLFSTKFEKYTYNVSICDKVESHIDSVGAMQITEDKKIILGKYDQSEIISGKNWILLTYLYGDAYATHCNASERMAQIMIVCNPYDLKGELRLLDEKRKNTSRHCSYWFELGSSVACDIIEKTEDPVSHGLGSGSVFCILFFTFAGLYLVLGFLYKRIIVGSKGIEQIPNYSFWRAFGNLQADACDFICRCGPRHESQAYRGIDDRLKAEEHDDQLLNM